MPEVEYSVLRNKLFVGRVSFPGIKWYLKWPRESIVISNSVILSIKLRVPDESVKNI